VRWGRQQSILLRDSVKEKKQVNEEANQ